jgi:hypothetical protein
MRRSLRLLLTAVVGCPLLFGLVLMVTRVGDRARFVTWPVVSFTALAAAVAVLGVWVGAPKPRLLAAGLLPAIIVSYFLPAAPFPLVAAFVAGLGAVAVITGGVACGVAAGIGSLMVVFVVLQGPAVECSRSSVSANSGPWWIEEPNRSVGSGTGQADGRTSSGTVQVGERHYDFLCKDARLRRFERVAGPVTWLEAPTPISAVPTGRDAHG